MQQTCLMSQNFIDVRVLKYRIWSFMAEGFLIGVAQFRVISSKVTFHIIMTVSLKLLPSMVIYIFIVHETYNLRERLSDKNLS